MREAWTAEYLREQLSTSWIEVQRDLDAPVLDTIMTCDWKVFILYPDHTYAVVGSIRPGDTNGQA
jgi:hypothetical protein